VQQALGRRAGQHATRGRAARRADDQQPGVVRLGRLVQRARRARAAQHAARDVQALLDQRGLDARDRRRAVGDEVHVAAGRPAGLDGRHDQRGAGEPGRGRTEVHGGAVVTARVVAGEDGLGHSTLR
jgi:hypothetical protein